MNDSPKANVDKVGIVLAGGSGSRLQPLTSVVSKQLLPVYNNPMIFYPIETLRSLGIEDIVIISDPKNLPKMVECLGDGSKFNCDMSYIVQREPEGIAQAYHLAESFIGGRDNVLILGDNLFLDGRIRDQKNGVVHKKVRDPSSYGVLEIGDGGKLKRIVEKPEIPPSKFACTGIYFFDSEVCEKSKTLKKSSRGEYEISDLINLYIKENKIQNSQEFFGDWFDCGSFEGLFEASKRVREIWRNGE